MATEVAIKTARVIAFNTRNHMVANTRVVDVVTSPSAEDKKSQKQHIQATVDAPRGEYPTYMVGATGGHSGLPTIFIPSYTGPS
jgi:hypothetical protein